MNIHQSQRNNAVIIAISGNFNGENVLKYRETFEQLHTRSCNSIIFDVTNMEGIDSSGIGLLVFIYKRIKPLNRKMVMVGLSGQPLALFQHLRIDRILNCQTSNNSVNLEEAYS